MNIKVKAANDYNKPFGIRIGQVYTAEVVEREIIAHYTAKWGEPKTEVIKSVEYVINGVGYSTDDFVTVD